MSFFLAIVSTQDHVRFLDNLSYQTAGLVVVIFALTILFGAVAVVGRLLRPHEKKIPVPVPAVTTPATEAEIPPEVIAVIAAAVAVTLRKPHRILRIQPANNPWLQAWAGEGRRQIFQSHQLR